MIIWGTLIVAAAGMWGSGQHEIVSFVGLGFKHGNEFE